MYLVPGVRDDWVDSGGPVDLVYLPTNVCGRDTVDDTVLDTECLYSFRDGDGMSSNTRRDLFCLNLKCTPRPDL